MEIELSAATDLENKTLYLMYLIFDIETTGFPTRSTGSAFGTYPHYTNNAAYDSARIVQIAWYVAPALSKRPQRLCRIKKDIAAANNNIKSFISNRGSSEFNIENSQFHGITNEIADADGIEFAVILDNLAHDLAQCDTIVAHNLAFDYNILLNHCWRFNPILCDVLKSKKQYCTMLHATPILKLPMPWMRGAGAFKSASAPAPILTYKYPSLRETHLYFFNDENAGAHRADTDVLACFKCFRMLCTTDGEN